MIRSIEHFNSGHLHGGLRGRRHATGPPVLELLADGEGRWKRRSGEPVPELDGCIDVDISATPFTNTVSIRRLGLKLSESEDLTVTYLRVPAMLVGPERQRYDCLEARADRGRYRFEALPGGFSAELPVDADRLVAAPPGFSDGRGPGSAGR